MIRYGISDEQAWDVGLACGGTIDVLVEPRVPDAVVDAARDTATGRTGAGRWSRCCRGCAGAELRGARAGRRSRAADAMGRGRRRQGPRTTGRRRGDRPRADRRRADALLRGTSRTVQIRDRQFFIEAYPIRPRLVVVGAVEVARSLSDSLASWASRPWSSTDGRRSRRRSGSRRGPAGRRLAGRGRGVDRAGAVRCRGGAHARREVRRAGDASRRSGAGAGMSARWARRRPRRTAGRGSPRRA